MMESTTTPRTRRPLQVKAKPFAVKEAATASPAHQSDDIDFSDSISRIKSIAYLLFWIENARQILDTLNFYVDHSAEVREVLKSRNIRTGSDWNEEVSEAVLHLHTLQLDDAQSACAAVNGVTP